MTTEAQTDDGADEESSEVNLRGYWTRTEWRRLNDYRTRRAIEETGSAIIGRWEHKNAGGDTDAMVEYYYEPDAERPYEVRLDAIGFSERFNTRGDGCTVNKELMRSRKVAEELAVFECGAETADGGECAIEVGAPDEHCHLHSDEE